MGDSLMLELELLPVPDPSGKLGSKNLRCRNRSRYQFQFQKAGSWGGAKASRHRMVFYKTHIYHVVINGSLVMYSYVRVNSVNLNACRLLFLKNALTLVEAVLRRYYSPPLLTFTSVVLVFLTRI